MLQQGDYMCKLDFKGFKGHIFSNSIAQRLQESDIFSMHRQHMRIFLPVFWVRSCSKDFVKIAQVPLSIVRKLNIKMIIYLDDILLLGQTFQEVLMEKD